VLGNANTARAGASHMVREVLCGRQFDVLIENETQI
jgi:hypothetical protein